MIRKQYKDQQYSYFRTCCPRNPQNTSPYSEYQLQNQKTSRPAKISLKSTRYKQKQRLKSPTHSKLFHLPTVTSATEIQRSKRPSMQLWTPRKFIQIDYENPSLVTSIQKVHLNQPHRNFEERASIKLINSVCSQSQSVVLSKEDCEQEKVHRLQESLIEIDYFNPSFQQLYQMQFLQQKGTLVIE